MILLRGVFFLTFLLSFLFSSARHVLVLKESNQVNLSPYLFFFHDLNSTYSLDNILQKETQQLFVENHQVNPNIPYTKATIWGKFTIKNDTEEEWVLQISEAILDSFVLYSPQKNNYKVEKAGLYIPSNFNSYQTNCYTFDLKIQPHTQKTYFFKVKSIRLQFPLKVITFNNLIKSNHKHDLADGMYYGFILIMFLYNLFLYFSLKDKNYLFYIAYLFTAGFYIFWIKGHFTEFLNQDYLWLNQYGVTFSAVSSMTSVLFSIHFLELKIHLKKMFYTLKIMFYLLVIPIILNFLGHNLLASNLVQLIVFSTFLTIIISAIMTYLKGYRFARFFIIAWVFFLIGVMVYILKTANILPLNAWTANAMQIGSSWEMLLLSLALADRINIYRKKIKKSEQELKDLNQILTSQNTRLQEYTYMVSHNLRGPIASLLGMIDLYDEQNVQNSFNPEVIKHIKTASKNLDTIVVDLNTSIRTIENVYIDSETVILEDVFQKIQENLHLQIQEIKPKITFKLHLKELIINKPYLESILFNIFQNALKFRDKNRALEIEISSQKFCYQDDFYYQISIKDNGVGMNLTKGVDHIFKFYYRGQTHIEGRGIGLYLVRLQMETLGGKIQVQSTVGQGSSFTLLFPISKE